LNTARGNPGCETTVPGFFSDKRVAMLLPGWRTMSRWFQRIPGNSRQGCHAPTRAAYPDVFSVSHEIRFGHFTAPDITGAGTQ